MGHHNQSVSERRLPLVTVSGLLLAQGDAPHPCGPARSSEPGLRGPFFALVDGRRRATVPDELHSYAALSCRQALHSRRAGTGSMGAVSWNRALVRAGAGRQVPTAPNATLQCISPAANGGRVSWPSVVSWFALLAPAGTPDAVVGKLNAEVAKVLATDAFKARMATAGMAVTPSSPAELGALISADSRKWMKVAERIPKTD